MVRAELAAAKTTRAQAWIDDAERFFLASEEDYVNDVQRRDLAAFYLFLAIQECIDLAAHWVADAGWTPPDDAASTFDVLADRLVIDRACADGMRGAAGLRNRIAHGYALLDHQRLRAEALQGIPLIRRFLLSLAEAAGL